MSMAEILILCHDISFYPTGWSFATAIFYIFLTGIKKQRNHTTQSFLSTSYRDILIFWGLTMVRWKKSHAFPGCAKIMLWLLTAKAENPKHICALPISKNSTQIPSDTPQTPLRHPHTSPRHPLVTSMNKKTPTNANWHCQTYSNSTRQCLGVSRAGSLSLLASVVICWHLLFPGDVWGVSGGCLGGVQEISGWYS